MARVVSALLGGAACGLSAPIRIAVDPADTFGSWESFGVSFAWWGNVYGGNGTGPMLADLVYSFDNVSWPPTPGLTLPGLALNLARYGGVLLMHRAIATFLPCVREPGTMRAPVPTHRTTARPSRTHRTFHGGRRFRRSGWTGRQTTQIHRRGIGLATRIRSTCSSSPLLAG